METMVYRILRRRQLLRDVLNLATRDNPAQLAVVREALREIAILNLILDEQLTKRTSKAG